MDRIIAASAYWIASEITGCKPKWYGECKEFDEVYDEAIKRLREKLLENKE